MEAEEPLSLATSYELVVVERSPATLPVLDKVLAGVGKERDAGKLCVIFVRGGLEVVKPGRDRPRRIVLNETDVDLGPLWSSFFDLSDEGELAQLNAVLEDELEQPPAPPRVSLLELLKFVELHFARFRVSTSLVISDLMLAPGSTSAVAPAELPASRKRSKSTRAAAARESASAALAEFCRSRKVTVPLRVHLLGRDAGPLEPIVTFLNGRVFTLGADDDVELELFAPVVTDVLITAFAPSGVKVTGIAGSGTKLTRRSFVLHALREDDAVYFELGYAQPCFRAPAAALVFVVQFRDSDQNRAARTVVWRLVPEASLEHCLARVQLGNAAASLRHFGRAAFAKSIFSDKPRVERLRFERALTRRCGRRFWFGRSPARVLDELAPVGFTPEGGGPFVLGPAPPLPAVVARLPGGRWVVWGRDEAWRAAAEARGLEFVLPHEETADAEFLRRALLVA
jgi:hypothetical protein